MTSIIGKGKLLPTYVTLLVSQKVSFYPQDAHNQVGDTEHLPVVSRHLSSNVLELVGIGSLPVW